MSDNIIEKKSYAFALETIRVYKGLVNDNEKVLSKQLLRSGTSIGANVMEGLRAQSRKDFISKMNIALKEANETEYWIKLLIDSNYLDPEKHQMYLNNSSEICRILNSIVKTSKENLYGTVEEIMQEY
ncbi:MAG: four helix bundle protein [Gudongella sp.]|nr:four helix bundle protein [Gudongella sp.]